MTRTMGSGNELTELYEGVTESFTYPLYSDLYQKWPQFPKLFSELK